MKRRINVIATALAVAIATTVGFAASLGGLTGARLGAGDAPVVSCDSDGVTIGYNLSGTTVTSVDIGAIAPACIGGELSVTLADSTGSSVGSGGPQVVAGATENVILAPQPAAASVSSVHIVIVGP